MRIKLHEDFSSSSVNSLSNCIIGGKAELTDALSLPYKTCRLFSTVFSTKSVRFSEEERKLMTLFSLLPYC